MQSASCTVSHKFMFKYTSPRMLGSVYRNMNSGVLEAESVKFVHFSEELNIEFKIP